MRSIQALRKYARGKGYDSIQAYELKNKGLYKFSCYERITYFEILFEYEKDRLRCVSVTISPTDIKEHFFKTLVGKLFTFKEESVLVKDEHTLLVINNRFSYEQKEIYYIYDHKHKKVIYENKTLESKSTVRKRVEAYLKRGEIKMIKHFADYKFKTPFYQELKEKIMGDKNYSDEDLVPHTLIHTFECMLEVEGDSNHEV